MLHTCALVHLAIGTAEHADGISSEADSTRYLVFLYFFVVR